MTREQRFWAKVNQQGPLPAYRPGLGPCWLWTATKNPRGYGLFSTNGSQKAAAHRFAYTLLVGPIPEGLTIDHLCRVRHCVKAIADEYGPAHLEPVTLRENLLRGDTTTARNAAKTHCPQGHPYDQTNTYRTPSTGDRLCRACQRVKKRIR